MTHARSLSEGQDGKSASSHRSKKFMNVTVIFLDDSSHVFQLQAKNLGQVLFDKVCKFINLLEVDYFGLECEDDKNTKYWLDALKPLCNQIATSFPTMYFCVKFYTPDPVQLEDEFTRYLFGLQMRKDLANGHLQCNDNIAAIMLSYIVQADGGDYNPEKCSDSSYLSAYKFIPFQDEELEKKIMENHKKLIGQTPAEADLNLLETARRCELYGVKLTAAKDQEGVPLNLAVAHLGVLVFQNFTKINTFSWVKIRKLSFKRKKFLIKLHPEGYGLYKDTVEYFFEGRNDCKNFWKKCIENHTFFRCNDSKQGMRQKPKIFSRGSSFRYSGRTQKQVSEFVRDNCFKRQPFQRSTSLRTPSSASRSTGLTTPPQPLLPVTSASCGSISEISKEAVPSQKLTSTSEPTTPHVAPDLQNSNDSKAANTSHSGLVSPDGFQSPDFLGQDTDDNISHDSYHVLEKETFATNNESMLLTNNNSNNDNDDVPIHNQNGGKENVEDQSPKIENNNNSIPEPLKQNLNNPLSEKDSGLKDFEDLTSSGISNSELSIRHAGESSQITSLSSLNRLSVESDSENNAKNIEDVSISEVKLRNLANNAVENQNLLNDSQQNFGTSTFYISSPYAVRLANRKKSLSDKSYCLAKELLMTERTFRKDLEIVNMVFRDELLKQGDLGASGMERVLSIIDPLYEQHCSLLRDLEQRLAFWEGRPMNRNSTGIRGVGDILLKHRSMIQLHSSYFKELPRVLELIYGELSGNPNFAYVYHQFEAQKVCYVPLTSLLLRPAFRLLYYTSLTKDLLSGYNIQHEDYENCTDIYKELKNQCENFDSRMFPIVNYMKLMELDRSLMGFPNLVDKNREFVREGSLFKLTNNGSHQHMFFLFSDTILYTVRMNDGHIRFKVQSQLPIPGLVVEQTEPKHGVNNCLLLRSPERQFLIGASSEYEFSKWFKDITRVVQNSQSEGVSSFRNLSSHSLSTVSSEYESSDDADDIIEKREGSYHVNTSIHICWHRNISISCTDLLTSMKHGLCGYLLRKFKNSSGWQKVWVVLANLCLFFYRSYSEESPLASLPLAGYRIMKTSSTDLVHGECIFKLVFKTHEYFFTVENKHTFVRWVEAISMCTLIEEENTKL